MIKNLLMTAVLLTALKCYAQLDVPFVSSGGPAGMGSLLRFLSGNQSTSIQESSGINIFGDASRPVRIRGANLLVGYNHGNQPTGNSNLSVNGLLGIGTLLPKAKFDIGSYTSGGNLSAVLARQAEGNGTGDGTFIGVRAYGTQQGNDGKSFSLEHSFYGEVNSGIAFHRGGSTTGGFITISTNNNTQQMIIRENGNVGIGTPNPTVRLAVNGTVRAKEVRVESANWPDYVFEEAYELPDPGELEAYIRANKHLPGIPTKEDIEREGIGLGEMNRLLLEKVEELTLLLLELNSRVEKVEGGTD